MGQIPSLELSMAKYGNSKVYNDPGGTTAQYAKYDNTARLGHLD